MENPGIDPGASRMRIERSTTWANPPCEGTIIFTTDSYSETAAFSVGIKIQLPLRAKINICLRKMIEWRIRVSIPVPLECKSSALPSELIPLANFVSSLLLSNNVLFPFYYIFILSESSRRHSGTYYTAAFTVWIAIIITLKMLANTSFAKIS